MPRVLSYARNLEEHGSSTGPLIGRGFGGSCIATIIQFTPTCCLLSAAVRSLLHSMYRSTSIGRARRIGSEVAPPPPVGRARVIHSASGCGVSFPTRFRSHRASLCFHPCSFLPSAPRTVSHTSPLSTPSVSPTHTPLYTTVQKNTPKQQQHWHSTHAAQ